MREKNSHTLTSLFLIFSLLPGSVGGLSSLLLKTSLWGSFGVKEGVVETSPAFEEWRYNMRMCESSDNPNAINENDLDGTPSYGLWQMKPNTFKGWVQKYDLFNWREWEKGDYQNNIMSREHQEEIMDHVIVDPGINWKNEFPNCFNKYGKPPKVGVEVNVNRI